MHKTSDNTQITIDPMPHALLFNIFNSATGIAYIFKKKVKTTQGLSKYGKAR